MSKLSAEAFLHQVESGKRTTDAQIIYNWILERSWIEDAPNLKELQRCLKYSHGTSTARLSELCDMGVIYEDNNGYFHITPSDKVGEYAAMRDDARYKKWKKLGDKNGWFNQLRIV